ncbi:hypothetical protein ABH15_09705 [Methanoculleus taiwanensis]|uniref:PAS domain-containing protein n=2 Tax=Methanoculleus taiwanensis TaxID=1550565 RepID=A0A498H0M9_9EURY|nr:hypothetical protein ABH15_09705 [Methanoculleus taiwanensis]
MMHGEKNTDMSMFFLFTIFHVLNELEDGVVLVGQDGRIRWVNAAMRRFFELRDREVAGMQGEEFFLTVVAPTLERPEEVSDAVLSSNRERRNVHNLELHAVTPEGREFWLEYTSRPLNIYPMLQHRLDIYRKITRWKTTERRLTESEERYRMLFNKGSDAVLVFTLSPDSMPVRFIEVNEVAERRLGYTRDELLNLSPLDITPPERIGEISAVLKQFRVTDELLFEMEHVTKGGRRIPVEINALRFLLQGRPTVLSISRDISERKRTEEIRKKAFEQIEQNIEQFAVLGDHIRNPLAVIVGLAGIEETPASAKILEQAALINGTIDRLDRGWVESEKVRRFLRKHYGQR